METWVIWRETRDNIEFLHLRGTEESTRRYLDLLNDDASDYKAERLLESPETALRRWLMARGADPDAADGSNRLGRLVKAFTVAMAPRQPAAG
jgi:hypothetical protein